MPKNLQNAEEGYVPRRWRAGEAAEEPDTEGHGGGGLRASDDDTEGHGGGGLRASDDDTEGHGQVK
ncbi:MAG: hypothetical protein A2X23_05800 [Chloroflexi bacterium GWC2_73_18]|nr:MAG: hypothetical protein A2X23_05800 [Chloroflexi bacterium GWC2_73_18]